VLCRLKTTSAVAAAKPGVAGLRARRQRRDGPYVEPGSAVDDLAQPVLPQEVAGRPVAGNRAGLPRVPPLGGQAAKSTARL